MTYTMSPRVRTLALTVHIAVSVGWIGAVAAYLSLDVVAATSPDPALVRAAWFGMGVIGWAVIVPLAVASLATGCVMALGTRWGLFRHYWVLLSFVLTVFAVAVLLTQVDHFSAGMAAAAGRRAPGVQDRGPIGGTLLHSAGGLVVLLVVTALNVSKPTGLTPYGWRKRQAERRASGGEPVDGPR